MRSAGDGFTMFTDALFSKDARGGARWEHSEDASELEYLLPLSPPSPPPPPPPPFEGSS